MKICISAPETSGDILASYLIPILKELYSGATLVGLVGPRCSSLGVTPLWHTADVNVMGIVEVCKKLPKILWIRQRLLKYCYQEDIDMFIGVDSPDFNFYIEHKLKKRGVHTVHFVSPSIWAWRMKRMAKIKYATNAMLCLFPFEPKLYHQHGIKAYFVGHPLVHLTKRASYNKRQKIILMPGSRLSEINYILPILVRTAMNIHQIDANYHFHIPLAHSGCEQLVHTWIQDTNITYSIGDAYEHISDADVVVAASGTVTL